MRHLDENERFNILVEETNSDKHIKSVEEDLFLLWDWCCALLHI
jgi:hypothetical protein